MNDDPIKEIIAGDYSLRQMRRRYADGLPLFWVENKDGEGAEVTEAMVAEMLEAFFKQNF